MNGHSEGFPHISWTPHERRLKGHEESGLLHRPEAKRALLVIPSPPGTARIAFLTELTSRQFGKTPPSTPSRMQRILASKADPTAQSR